MKKKKSNSKIKPFLFLLILAGLMAILFKAFSGDESIFKIESSSSTFKSPTRKEAKEVDNAGHSEDFWTNTRFKW